VVKKPGRPNNYTNKERKKKKVTRPGIKKENVAVGHAKRKLPLEKKSAYLSPEGLGRKRKPCNADAQTTLFLNKNVQNYGRGPRILGVGDEQVPARQKVREQGGGGVDGWVKGAFNIHQQKVQTT